MFGVTLFKCVVVFRYGSRFDSRVINSFGGKVSVSPTVPIPLWLRPF